jgi:hypothetical protein
MWSLQWSPRPDASVFIWMNFAPCCSRSTLDQQPLALPYILPTYLAGQHCVEFATATIPMGRIRADNAACAICMDSLFTKLDDLDQLEPACAPDCGKPISPGWSCSALTHRTRLPRIMHTRLVSSPIHTIPRTSSSTPPRSRSVSYHLGRPRTMPNMSNRMLR